MRGCWSSIPQQFTYSLRIMKSSHATALQTFTGRLQWLFVLRMGLSLATMWFFVWGVAILAMRFFGVQNIFWLTLGLVAVIPVVLLAGRWSKKKCASPGTIRAAYDHLNKCGGLIMSAEFSQVEAWLAQLPNPSVPKLRWRSGRSLLSFSASILFVAAALLLPNRFAHISLRHPLEIGQLVQQLQAEVNVLSQEKIIESQKSAELQKQLSQLENDSTGNDPGKTWEALDHIKQSDSDEAKQAAQEAITKTTAMSQAETVARAMEQASTAGMDTVTESQAMQDLASLLNNAKLENGFLNAQIPPQLLTQLNGLNKEQLEKLQQALESQKGLLSMDISNLANLKMIDPAMLAKLMAARVCENPNALAQYLCSCTNGCDAAILCRRPGKGGPGGGGPAAPMTWSAGASEKDLKFQEHVLPPSAHLSDAQLMGVSKTAPEPAAKDVSTQHGALDNAAGAGGSARAQVILPEQRQAVQNYFKRDN
jgi:hypothetical protein